MAQTTSTELTRSTISDEWLAKATGEEGATLGSLVQHYMKDGLDVWDDEGDGVFNLDLITDKSFLEGLPFLITRWRFNTSDKFKDEEGNPGVFVSVEIAYQTDPKNGSPLLTGVFNDGSSGVRKQLEEITRNRIASGKGDPFAGRGVRKGLRKSEYQRETGNNDKSGNPITESATTYYLDI